MLLRYHSRHILGVFFIQTHFMTVLAIYASVSPTNKTVFVGETVEFQCAVRDKGSFEELLWVFQYPGDDPNSAHTISAEQTGTFVIAGSGENHGHYSIEYSAQDVFSGSLIVDTIHRLLLRMVGVLPADEGRFACGYQSPVTGIQVGLGEWAYLTILIPPNEPLPRCAFAPVASSSVEVTLTCDIDGGKPPPFLTWHKENVVISQPSEQSNEFRYELQPNDNGVEFICTASGPSLPVGGSCSVIPLRVYPTVSISTPSMPITVNSDVTLTCVGSGMPMISKLEWRHNGKTVSDTNMELEYQIVDISYSSSELHVFNVQLDNNNDIITCYVEIPSGLNSEQSVTIAVVEQKMTINPTGKSATTVVFSDQQTTMYARINTDIGPTAPSLRVYTMLTIVIPLAIVCVILLIIVAVFIRCWQMKRRDESPCSPDDPYVISELPREHRTTTMTTDHLYEDRISPSVDSTSNVENTVNHSFDLVDDLTPSYERHIPFIEEPQNQNPQNEGIYIDI